MSRLRSIAVAAILLSCAIPSTSKAFAVSAGGAFFNNNVGNGVGLMLYPQFYIAYGITPELQIGAEYAKTSNGGLTTYSLYIPAMVGVRFDFSKVLPLGPVAPFVAAHVGYGGFASFVTGTNVSTNANSNNIGYNAYAGTAFWLGDSVGLGVEGGVDVVNSPFAANTSNEIIGCARAILQLR